MVVSNIKALLASDVQTVWEVVTSMENYQWRSDLQKIERLSENQFVEYTPDGFATTFTITRCEPCRRWEFEMENKNMTGHWVGIFAEKDGQTQIDFTETVIAKKWYLNPFVKLFLKKQQNAYVLDLKKALQ